jgi:peptidoglycan/xylan/chitin deacetylase (PgdA/CDA1 family)
MRAILTYHSIDESGSPISMPLDAFERHARWLASGAVRVIGLDELATLGDDRDAVALTFDDGFESVATRAAPVLRRHALPATLFIVSDHVGGNNAWGGQATPGIPVMPLLDWRGIHALAEDGWTLGAHSRTHPDLTALSPDDVRREVEGSLDEIQARTGVRPRCFAYPYGRVNERVASTTASLCERAYTTSMRVLSAGDRRERLPRLDAYYFRSPGWLERWGQPHWHAYVAGRSMARTLRDLVTR